MPAEAVPVKSLAHVKASPTERVLLRTLVDRYPHFIDRDALTSRLFSGAKAPESDFRQMQVYAARVRKLLAPHGWTISGSKGGRGNTGVYRLERLA
jgi:DNA-binding winged helix-turn-helix (wHTH) protein